MASYELIPNTSRPPNRKLYHMAKFKTFNDAIHGTIEVHPLAVKIIDTPQFQRLRFIKQVGCAYFVYPSASHNRFEHSLGVYHLAGELVSALKERQPDFEISDEDVLCVQIAGLCHDLGHGPYSHVWEMFMRKQRPHSPWKHEDASIKMLDYLYEKNDLKEHFNFYGLSNIDFIFIKDMIRGSKSTELDAKSQERYDERIKKKEFLFQIVANPQNGIDVDKWDYFLRDGLSLGIQVSFKYSRLVKHSRIIQRNDPEGSLEICYRDKEQANIYDMFRTRMMLHKNAYQHRIVKTIDTMLIDVFMCANEHITYMASDGKTKLPLCEVVDDMHALTYLNDDILNQIYRSTSKDLEQAQKIMENIFTRRLYPIFGFLPPTIKDWTVESVLQEMEKGPALNELLKKEKTTLDVSVISLNYSQGPNNPLLRVGFFTKEEPEVYKKHIPKETSKLLPKYWEEKFILVLCKGDKEDPLLPEAKREFLRLFKES